MAYRKGSVSAALVACIAAGVAVADVDVSSTNTWSWGENIGWQNWGAAAGADRVRLSSTYMGGFVWGENVGWINLGDGTPTNGVSYANVNGTDFGVNMDSVSGELSGYAWGENIGWINFGTTPFVGAEGAYFDFSTFRLHGYAWGENVGWINLDDTNFYVGFTCTGDLNGDGQVDGVDLGLLLGAWGTANPAADLNGSGNVDGVDLGLLLGSWGACW